MAEHLSHPHSNPVEPPPSIDRLVRGDNDFVARAKNTRRYSRLVRSMRLILPVVALAIVVVLMVWSDDKAPIQAVPREDISPQTVSRNELVNPKFQSEDSNNQPYSITADKAVQNAENMDAVLLDNPVADLRLKNGQNVTVKANGGQYNQKSGTLDLNGSVFLRHDNGYEIQTEQMNIDVDGQVMTSSSAVEGHGPQADITAQGLEADGKTDTVIFTGPAKLILKQANPSRSMKDDK